MVAITKTGLRYTRWDEALSANVEVRRETFFSCLREECEVEDGTTLRHVFLAVEADLLLKRFLQSYCWCDVDAFHREARLEPVRKSDLEYLVVSKSCQVDEFGANIRLDFSGVGEPRGETLSQRDADGKTRFALDFTPVSEIAHLSIRLDPVVKVFQDDEEKTKTRASFSLLEILGEIYDEISFHGSPARRDKLGAELLADVEEIRAGTAKLTPWEDIDEIIQ